METSTTRLLRALLALVLLAMPLRLAADPADIAATSRSVVRVVLIEEVTDSTFGARQPRYRLLGHGSGIAVAPDLILTNAHVVVGDGEEEAGRVLIVPSEGRRGYVATLVDFSRGQDLALLRIKGGTLPVATLSPQTVPDGAAVYAVGYPGNVDMAQGLNAIDMIMPQPPVKTQGTSSAGRASRSFDTVLHTAPIAAGNSGGPLLDGCGRVVGINSFGTFNEDASDSDFFFAVSMREVLEFLRTNQVKPQIAALPCQSMADFNRAQADRLTGEKAIADAEANRLAQARERLEQQAQLAIIAERENAMALAGFALIVAMASAAGSAWLRGQNQRRASAMAAALSAAALAGALYAWFSRPGLNEIERRAEELARAQSPATGPATEPGANQLTGALRCVLDPSRSRVTVSPITDLDLNWRADGCANARTQFALDADGWSRLQIDDRAQAVSLARFDPVTGSYSNERYLLDFDEMEQVRTQAAKLPAPKCGSGDVGAHDLAQSQATIAALLPTQPNERLVYKCTRQIGEGPAK